MPRVRYKIQKSQSTGKYLVQVNFNYNAGRFRKSIGISLDNKNQWNPKIMRVNFNHNNMDEFNRLMDTHESSIMSTYYNCINNGIVLNDKILLEALDPDRSSRMIKRTTLEEFIRIMIKERRDSRAYGVQILHQYNSFLKLILEVSEASKQVITFDMIDDDLLTDFKTFLIKSKQHSVNTVSKHFRVFNTVLNAARRKGIEVKDDYKHFKTREVLSDKIYLSLDEINALNGHQYRLPSLRNAVDLFIICCYTGLRRGDIDKISMDNIRKHRGIDMLFLKQSKTGDDVVIPLHKVVLQIIERNNGLPRSISGQKLNQFIQEAGRQARIDTPIVHYYDKGGIKYSETMPKWKLITSHTARRSFATNMHIMGVDTKLIMNITGHKTESNLLKYIRIKNEDSAVLLAKSSFFN
jgi:integrase